MDNTVTTAAIGTTRRPVSWWTGPPRTSARQGRPREPRTAATLYRMERQLARIKDHVQSSHLLEVVQSNKVEAWSRTSSSDKLELTEPPRSSSRLRPDLQRQFAQQRHPPPDAHNVLVASTSQSRPEVCSLPLIASVFKDMCRYSSLHMAANQEHEFVLGHQEQVFSRSWWQAPANQGQKFALCRSSQVFSRICAGILRCTWLPIKNTSLFSATKSKYFQVSTAHKPAGASSLSFKDEPRMAGDPEDAAAKKNLAEVKDFEVKRRRCIILDPDQAEVRVKLHWFPFYLPDDCVKRALQPFGKVEEVSRKTWRVGGFEGVQSTTRTVRLTLKEGVTIEHLPHQLRLVGCTALVLAPGRAPLCLRCRKTGHIRKECRVPRCESCRRFGHTRSECVRTYADVAHAGAEEDLAEHFMDQVEAEAATAEAGGTTINPELRGQGGTSASTSSAQTQVPPAEVKAQANVTPTQETAGSRPTHPLPPREPDGKEDEHRAHRASAASARKADCEDDGVQMEAVDGSAKRPLLPSATSDDEHPAGLQNTVL
ncbi:uncharacterized protein ISCGN_031430 [Ixodes scapularis]